MTVREAVTDAENEISQEEAAKACPRLARPRTGQDGGTEQPHVCQRSADVRPRNLRVRRSALSEIVDDLRIRKAADDGSLYATPAARRRDVLGFADMVIADAKGHFGLVKESKAQVQ